MYIGWATKCAGAPLIVTFRVDSTPAKFACVMLPSDVVMPVL